MKTVIGSIRHQLSVANKEHYIWLGAIVVIMIILAIFHHKWKDDNKKMIIWCLLCLLPFIISCVHEFIYVRGISWDINSHYPLYAIAICALLPIPLAKRKNGYKFAVMIVGLVTFSLGFYYLLMSPNHFNHTRESYTKSFHSFVQDMDKHYILKEWKEIDFAALEEKYMPMVREAEQEQDVEKFADAVMKLCSELHDGHVYVGTDIPNRYRFVSYTMDYKLREYGLAMVQLDNGDVIAVCTTEEVQKLGIEDGTVITKWDGKDILQACSENVPDLGMSVKANADRVAAIVLSGIGGETVDVTFVDKSGKEQTVTLTDNGLPHTQLEAFQAYEHFEKLGTPDENQSLKDENFTTKMLDEKCGYLRLTSEQTDNVINDYVGYMKGNHSQTRKMFHEKLSDLKSQGMEYLVIDLRNNEGGFDEIAFALCAQFTTDDLDYYGVGIRKNGGYKQTAIHGTQGDGEFADLKVVALTNFGCISAGDGASLYLSKLPNVTLAGLTDSYGCNQEAGGLSVLSSGHVYVAFPVGIVLNEKGEPNIDTRADLISRNPVEERIPLDYDAAMKIFHDKEDYELEWAVQYLENGD